MEPATVRVVAKVLKENYISEKSFALRPQYNGIKLFYVGRGPNSARHYLVEYMSILAGEFQSVELIEDLGSYPYLLIK